MEDKSMTGEEVLQEILGALNGNGMQQAANGVFELCAYPHCYEQLHICLPNAHLFFFEYCLLF